MAELDEELLCPLCSELYDEENHVPLTLPRCGHTFCRPCLNSCGKKGHFPCPTCRKRHLKPPVAQIPANVNLLTQAEIFRESTLGRCPSHGNLQEFWCRQCNESLCSSCDVGEGHDVVSITTLLAEKKEEIRKQGDAILEQVTEEKQKMISKVKTCSLQLLKTCQASTITTTSGEDIKAVISESKKTTDVKSALGSLKRMKSIYVNLRSASAMDGPQEEEEEVGEEEEEELTDAEGRESCSSERESCRLQNNDCHQNRYKRSKSKEPMKQRDHTENEDVIRRRNTTKNNNTKNINNNINDYSNNNPQRDVYSLRRRTTSNPPTGGPNNKTNENYLNGSPLMGLLDSSMWPLKCCVYNEDNRRADLKWEGGRLHLYALSSRPNDAHFMIKMSVLQTLIPKDHPEVFIDATAGSRYLGRIYIRLWGHLRRAHNFLALCMGTHGPSYEGGRFQELFAKGIPGECLHAGVYKTRRGTECAAGVLKDLEWEGKFTKPMSKGLVVGAGSGRQDRDACFDICTRGNLARNFACPFGEVIDGWDVVMAIVSNKPIRQVFMTSVGVVIPDQAKTN